MSPAEKLASMKPKRKSRNNSTHPDNHLREIRLAIGLTQREVGDETGLSNAFICQAEKGSEISLSNALRLASFFGKAVEEIWTQ